MHRISNDEITIEIDLTYGARISSLKWKQYEFAVPKRDHLMTWGWFGMVPWAGRINLGKVTDLDGTEYQLPTHWDPPHAEHGYGFHSEWQIVEENTFELVMPAPYFPAIARQTFTLSGNSLTWTLDYIANGCTLPAWVGFHPWFPRSIDSSNQIELLFNAEKMLVRGADHLPTGKYSAMSPGPWDDAFTGVSHDPIVRWGDIAQIQITSNSPWWVVYDEDPLGICVEPQSAPPDAANLGITGSHSIQAKFTFSAVP